MSRNEKASGAAGDRDARLKQALKANLQRRKAQARARADMAPQDETKNEAEGGPDREAGQDG